MNTAQNSEAIKALENQLFYVTAGKSYRSMMFTPDAILFAAANPTAPKSSGKLLKPRAPKRSP
jgi:hypothetical protein